MEGPFFITATFYFVRFNIAVEKNLPAFTWLALTMLTSNRTVG